MEEERDEVMTEERWRAIPDYEGWYEAGDLGNIKRVNGDNSARAGKILKPWTSHGYKRVSLYKNGEETSSHVHQIIMETFVGPCPNDKEVNHKDGDKANNELANLEYVTHAENVQHAFDTGLLSRRGEKNSQSKLTEENVHEARRLLAMGVTQTEIAKKFGVNKTTICNIANRKNWAWLKEEGDDKRT